VGQDVAPLQYRGKLEHSFDVRNADNVRSQLNSETAIINSAMTTTWITEQSGKCGIACDAWTSPVCYTLQFHTSLFGSLIRHLIRLVVWMHPTFSFNHGRINSLTRVSSQVHYKCVTIRNSPNRLLTLKKEKINKGIVISSRYFVV